MVLGRLGGEGRGRRGLLPRRHRCRRHWRPTRRVTAPIKRWEAGWEGWSGDQGDTKVHFPPPNVAGGSLRISRQIDPFHNSPSPMLPTCTLSTPGPPISGTPGGSSHCLNIPTLALPFFSKLESYQGKRVGGGHGSIMGCGIGKGTGGEGQKLCVYHVKVMTLSSPNGQRIFLTCSAKSEANPSSLPSI